VEWLIVLLFVFFLAGIPITFSLGIASVIGLIVTNTPLVVLAQRLWTALDTFPIVAVPLFILAGALMSYGGIARRLVDFAQSVVGHYPSGLAMVGVVGCVFFAAVSGSAIATAAAMGGLLIPLMSERGYHRTFSAPLLASARTIGPVIPPSIPLVIYGIIANTSIAQLFAAGFIPGVLMGGGLMVFSYFIGKRRGYVGQAKRSSCREIVAGFGSALLALIMPIIIIGGIVGGVFTATESGVVAVVYALILGLFVYKELRITQLPQVLYETGVTSGTILIILGTASLFTWILTMQQVPQQLSAAILAMEPDRITILLMINIVLLIAGTMIDTISAIIIFTPLFLPMVLALGVDPIHFGLIVTVNLTIGMVTPPVGVCLFVTARIANISIGKMLKDLWPMLLVLLTVLMLVTYVEDLVMFIPRMMR
jgi:C4-dicarboxylate transporter, DctM subunit